MLESSLICLAMNIYHEARGEPLVGRIAVAQVVMNRVKSPQFPNTICDVVKQGKYYNNHPIRYQCQFTWWCDGKSDKITSNEDWQKALSVAESVALLDIPDVTENSLYYHTTKVNPYWADHYQKVVQIQNHIFYH